CARVSRTQLRDLHAVAARGLGRVERAVRGIEERVWIAVGPLARERGDADADGDRERDALAVDRQRLNRAAAALGHDGGVLRVERAHEDAELLSPVARD